MEHLEPDQLVLLALGERAAPSGTGRDEADPNHSDESARVHLQECSACRDELSQLARTVELARQAGELGLQNPVVLPASIWSGIAQELGIGTAPASRTEQPRVVDDHPTSAVATSADRAAGGRGTDAIGADLLASELADQVRSAESRYTGGDFGPTAPHRRRHSVVEPTQVGPGRRLSWRRGLLVAAAVVAIGAAVATGVLLGRRDAPPALAVQSQADLMPMPTGPPTAHGSATITQTPNGLTLSVAARQLPLRQGYYEVWLYNPTADQMVAVGTLGAAGDGAWSLASTIDLRSYSIVNVSAQDFDGNPAHKTSVLQGPLTH